MSRRWWILGVLLGALIVLLVGLSLVADRGSTDTGSGTESGRSDSRVAPVPPGSSDPRVPESRPDRGSDGPDAQGHGEDRALVGGSVEDGDAGNPEIAGSASAPGSGAAEERVIPDAGYTLKQGLSLLPKTMGRKAAIAMTPDGKLVALGRPFRREGARLWLVSTESDEIVGSTNQGGFASVLGLSFDEEGKVLWLLTESALLEYAVPHLEVLGTVTRPDDPYMGVSGENFDRFAGHAGGVTLLQKSLLSQGNDGEVEVALPDRRDARRDWRVLILRRFHHKPTLFAASPDGSFVALLESPPEACPEVGHCVAGRFGLVDNLRVINMASGELAWQRKIPPRRTPRALLRGKRSPRRVAGRVNPGFGPGRRIGSLARRPDGRGDGSPQATGAYPGTRGCCHLLRRRIGSRDGSPRGDSRVLGRCRTEGPADP